MGGSLYSYRQQLRANQRAGIWTVIVKSSLHFLLCNFVTVTCTYISCQPLKQFDYCTLFDMACTVYMNLPLQVLIL